MKKQKLFPKYRVPQIIFFFMTLLCWSMTLFQFASKQLKTEKAVPAFQNQTMSFSEAIPAFQTEKSQTLELSSAPKDLTQKTCSTYFQSLIKSIDSGATLISSHSDTGYSDFYLYSPVLHERFQISPATSAGSNLQIVFVWNKDGSCKHIYLGIPCIEYCF